VTPPSPTHQPQLAFFDHVYAVVDAGTAEEISRCDYLRGLGRFEVGTTVADGKTWTGRYLFGRTTYVELFGPTDLDGGADSTTGIGLSTHAPGDLAKLAARMKGGEAGVEVRRRIIQEGDQDLPWFDYLSPVEPAQGLSLWVMEFLTDPSDLEVRDSAYLKWAEERGNAEPNGRGPSLGEVCSVELGATAMDIAVAERLLDAAGYAVARFGDALSASDAQMTIMLHRAGPDVVGLSRIEFELATPAVSTHAEAIGRSTLTVGPNRRAVWEFNR
jgi:Family of unknown function (DUF5829)